MTFTLSPTFKLCAILFLAISGSVINAQTLSPYLYGQNHWMADGDHGRLGYLKDLWPRVAESGVKLVRIGGNGYEREFPPRTKLDEMVSNIRSAGAEPLIQIPRHFSSLETKELVKYYTRKNSKKVTYWSIGNEPQLNGEYSEDEIYHYILRIAKAMKSASPDIKIFIYDEAWLRMPEYGDFIGGRLDLTGLKENGAWLIDGVSFHNYPNGQTFTRDDVVVSGPQRILKQIDKLSVLVNNANTKNNRKGSEALLWAMTEFNVTFTNPNREVSGYGNPSFLGGQFIAEIIGYGMQNGAFTMAPWCINETDVVATDFGYLGLPSEFYPRSSYYHMQMMSSNMKGSFASSKDNQNYVKTIATKDKDTIAVLIMNQSQTENFDFTVGFNGEFVKPEKPLTVSVDAKINRTFEGEISAQTSKLFIFDDKGKLQKTIVYGLEQNLANAAPVIK